MWLSVTINNINSCSEVRASSYCLIKNNKITAEEQDIDKLGKLYSGRKACGQKWLTTYVYQADKCALHIHITYVRATRIEV